MIVGSLLMRCAICGRVPLCGCPEEGYQARCFNCWDMGYVVFVHPSGIYLASCILCSAAKFAAGVIARASRDVIPEAVSCE